MTGEEALALQHGTRIQKDWYSGSKGGVFIKADRLWLCVRVTAMWDGAKRVDHTGAHTVRLEPQLQKSTEPASVSADQTT